MDALGPEAAAGLRLDAHLQPHYDAPLAVAFSGGGDSLALLLIAKAWADRNGRRMVAMTVDHQLRPEGAAWALWCADRADRLGVQHRVLVWDGPKPATGLSAAARHARHALLAEGARGAGARVILMGHTADDQIEAALMREAGSTLPSSRVWNPSPAWPEGRGLFLLRPLLDLRRDAIRLWLSARGETWIEDPANVDPASSRAQARRRVEASRPLDFPLIEPPTPRRAPDLLGAIAEGPAGDLTLPVSALLLGADPAAILGTLVVCVAGASRPPRRAGLNRLLDRIRSGWQGASTLGQTKITVKDGLIHCARDVGVRGGGPFKDVETPAGTCTIWDGRFSVRPTAPGARIGALAGRATRLPPQARRALACVPALARPSLPLILTGNGSVLCPTLVQSADYGVDSLVLGRLKAALGENVNEATVPRMAEWPAAS